MPKDGRWRVELAPLATGGPQVMTISQGATKVELKNVLDRSLSGSLYELLEGEYRLTAGEAEERFEVVGATAAEARVLDARAGAPLVAIARTAWGSDGRAFEHSRDLFRADRVRIVVRVRGRSPSTLGSSVEVIGPGPA